ncbi:hypothetical protein ATOBIA_N03650 [Atopobiaceae bacterium P1]|nr:hypothetical protein ATOBIA_N03650 [Atopobiaceae bacterium P1]
MTCGNAVRLRLTGHMDGNGSNGMERPPDQRVTVLRWENAILNSRYDYIYL